MSRSYSIALCTFFLLARYLLFSQSSDTNDSGKTPLSLQDVDKKMLTVQIATRLLDNKALVVWNNSITKNTLSGKSIQIVYNGYNVRLTTDIVPYLQENNLVLVVAQGQIWLKDLNTDEIVYRSSMESITAGFGEKIFFFPLGKVSSIEKSNYPIIEMEIQISSYNENLKNSSAEKRSLFLNQQLTTPIGPGKD